MQETTKSLAETRQEVDREFETASLAMMRAFEAVQRYRSPFEDAGADIPASGKMLDSYHDVAVTMHYVLRCIAITPTGKAAAAAVAEALELADIERVGSDRKAHPPTRRATIAGLNGLIEERSRQLDDLIESHVAHDPESSVETADHGIAVALRAVRRERDALVYARDLV